MPTDHMTHADLDFLAQLTGDVSLLGPLSPRSNVRKAPSTEGKRKKPLVRRDEPVEALLLSAVLSGSGPVTRHHFGHGRE